MSNQRPKLDKDILPKDFKDFYWLKQELVLFCKENNISSYGGKINIANRIYHFLETGERKESINKLGKPHSNFDWNVERLTLETIITDNYKNTENVRAFLTTEIGRHFKFNVLFMNWMKQNNGKTLKDAVIEWKRIYFLKKSKSYESKIDAQFEYNTYMRDFLKDNPNMSTNDVSKYWMLKREIRGSKKYTKEDLKLTKPEK
ncbi:MAG: DUF6434 domain-containing protein [Bacteroidales bacterium]